MVNGKQLSTQQAQTPGLRESRLTWIMFGVLVLGYGVATLVYLTPRENIVNLDFWYHVELGLTQRLDKAESLANGLYPLGYPWVLARAVMSGIDVLRAGQALSWVGGLCALFATLLLARVLTQRSEVAVVAVALLCLNEHFMRAATREGNDMIAAGFQALAVAFLAIFVRDKCKDIWLPIASGALLGLAYLMRYTALLVFPVTCIAVLSQYRTVRTLRPAVAFLVAYGLAAGPQFLASLVAHGSLIYNDQAKNVWFGMYGNGDWVNNWSAVPDSITLLQVIELDPQRFLLHWWTQIRGLVSDVLMWPALLQISWIVALILFAIDRAHSVRLRVLCSGVLLAPLTVTALAWLQPRFMLLALCMQAALLTWLVWRVVGMLRVSSPRIVEGATLLGCAVLLAPGVTHWWHESAPVHPSDVHTRVRLAGATHATSVATNDAYLHATDAPDRARYAQIYFSLPSPQSAEQVIRAMRENNWQFLVLDYASGFGQYAAVRSGLREARREIAPLSLDAEREMYCAMPCGASDAVESGVVFDNGMRLDRFRLKHYGREGAVLLFWRTDRAMARSYKVSIRVLDAAGAVLAQVDAIPQQWTLPTTAWPRDLLIPDFYTWSLPERCIGCKLALVVYDEQTGEPIAGRSGDGTPFESAVVLMR